MDAGRIYGLSVVRGKSELVRYINERTGLDVDTVLKVLSAEDEFFVLQIEKVLGEKKGGGKT